MVIYNTSTGSLLKWGGSKGVQPPPPFLPPLILCGMHGSNSDTLLNKAHLLPRTGKSNGNRRVQIGFTIFRSTKKVHCDFYDENIIKMFSSKMNRSIEV